MSLLSGKNILIGVTGGIAAYKIPLLVRMLKKANASVKVVMTKAACDFVTPLTLSTLSENQVYTATTTTSLSGEKSWNNHVALAEWADFMIFAPLTANTMAKMATGLCDSLLLAVYLSAKCQVFFAPAMDLDMYQHPTTIQNIEKLVGFGNVMIPPTAGFLASGLQGLGRMEEPEKIMAVVESYFKNYLPLQNKKVLITAGPTYENIDPVRFIGNYSSGKMGFELAKTAANLGAEVFLVAGPVHEKTQHALIKRMDVTTADEMYDACFEVFDMADVAILAAAVSDYKPVAKSNHKIKKNSKTFDLQLTRNKDILKNLGKSKKHQFLVGFALETDQGLENAKKKLMDKNLDLIVLNEMNEQNSCFESDQNKISIIDKSNEINDYSLKEKSEIAKDIFNEILKRING